MLQVDDLNYEYPESLVATQALPRGQSRILKISRDKNEFSELAWPAFLDLFKPGDCLVFNNSKVLWARLLIRKASGQFGEILFLGHERTDPGYWEVMTRSLNIKEGKPLDLPGDWKAEVLKADRVSHIKIIEPKKVTKTDLQVYFEKWGHVPLPPYIETLRSNEAKAASAAHDKARYQNVWAKEWGSVAAPTAGLHFDESHIAALTQKGVNIAYVTLHVGAGTFLPLSTGELEDQRIHSEYMEVSQQTCEIVKKSQAGGHRIWACGTTALRALETAVLASGTVGARLPLIAPFIGETSLFITPGYKFLVVDGLLTNFHQPQSSLLALAATFATREPSQTQSDDRRCVSKILEAYKFAIDREFRLFSYGDLTVIY